VVALLADRDYSRHDTLVPFMGAVARMPRGPAWVSHASGAPILPVFMIRRSDDTFLLRFHPPIMPHVHDEPESVQQALSDVLAKEIVQDPVQWLMFEDVWSPSSFKPAAGLAHGLAAHAQPAGGPLR
jgi:lauroyl/myristoyl acyltransferase